MTRDAAVAERVWRSPVVARLYESRLWRRSPILAGLLGITFAREQALVLEGAALAGDESVLDLACASGIYARPLARRVAGGRVVGLDLSAAMLTEGQRRADVEGIANLAFVRGDASALPFAASCFDRVNCCGFLHLVTDLERVLAEVRRVLRPEGRLTAALLQRGGRFGALVRPLRRLLGVQPFPPALLEAQLRTAGFERITVLGGTTEWLLLEARSGS